MIYYEDRVITIYWEEEIRAVHTVWKGFASGNKYRNPLKKTAKLLALKKASNYLANQSVLSVLDKEDQVWTETIWWPMILKAGLKRLAIVMSEKKATEVFVREILERVLKNNPIDLGIFDNYEDAREWLGKGLH